MIPTSNSIRRALVAPLLIAAAARADDPAPGSAATPPAERIEAPATRLSANLNLASGYTFSHTLHGGGQVSNADASLALTLVDDLGGGHRLMFLYSTGYSSYDFSGASGPFADPWNDVLSLSLGTRYSGPVNDRLDLLVGVLARSEREIDADFGDSLTASAFTGGKYKVRDDLTLGLGVGVTTRLEENALVFPLPIVEWKISDRLVLSNSSRPVGFWLEYTAEDESFAVSLNARYDSRDIRLDRDGIAPEGAGGERRVSLALEGTLNLSRKFSLDAILGVNLWEQFTIRDALGNEIARADADPSVFFELSAALRF